MDKKTAWALAIGLIVLALAAAVFYFRSSPPSPAADTGGFGTDNPLEKAPDLNPTAKTNPFVNIKTNPFE